MTAITIRKLGRSDYRSVYCAMKDFTLSRSPETPDELWITQHNPVFTQGQAGKAEHILLSDSTPIIQSDRGGQITYHGPGQVVLYFLVDIKRARIGVRQMITLLENTVITLLKLYDIAGYSKPDAPGVYIDERKIASLGLRVRKGCTYHGLALNVDMDLSPFQNINPCGYKGLTMTQLADCTESVSIADVENELLSISQELLAASVQ